jgi:hypothetical protein
MDSAGVISDIKVIKDKVGTVLVFYVENNEPYIYGIADVLSSDTSVTINMDSMVLSIVFPVATGI